MSKFGPGETVKKGWIIIHEPGKIPDRGAADFDIGGSHNAGLE